MGRSSQRERAQAARRVRTEFREETRPDRAILGLDREPERPAKPPPISTKVDAEALLDAGLDPASLARPKARERRQFLLLIGEGFSIRKASEALGHPRLAFQFLLEQDDVFRGQYERAWEASADALEDEAFRRSFERGRFRLGSDRLLEMGLKARRPEKYGDRTQITGAKGGPIKAIVAHVDHSVVADVLGQAGLRLQIEESRGDGSG